MDGKWWVISKSSCLQATADDSEEDSSSDEDDEDGMDQDGIRSSRDDLARKSGSKDQALDLDPNEDSSVGERARKRELLLQREADGISTSFFQYQC